MQHRDDVLIDILVRVLTQPRELVIGKHVGVQLEEKLKENVDANLADQIDLAQEADNFAKCVSRRHMRAM